MRLPASVVMVSGSLQVIMTRNRKQHAMLLLRNGRSADGHMTFFSFHCISSQLIVVRPWGDTKGARTFAVDMTGLLLTLQY